MTSRTRASLGSHWLPRRLFWTAVLLLICLGGAGLATAADRPGTQAERPELTFATDRRAAPWLDEMLASLRALEADVIGLSAAARRLLVQVGSRAVDDLEQVIDAGDSSAAGLADSLSAAVALQEAPPEGVEPWRLGDENRQRLELIERALVLAAELPATWHQMAADARRAAELISLLRAHDESALAGVRAGSEARWDAAVESLEAALADLDELESLRRRLPAELPASTLDDLLADLRRHDEALLELYAHLAGGGSLDDEEAVRLRAAVDRAGQPIPTPDQRLAAAVAEVAGSSLSEGLSAIEQVRGKILEALDEGGLDEGEG